MAVRAAELSRAGAPVRATRIRQPSSGGRRSPATGIFVSTIAVLVVATRAGNRTLRRAAAALLAVEVVQGVIGFAQYFLDLPVLLVAAHMLGAALTAAALTAVLVAASARLVRAADRSVPGVPGV